MATIVPGVTTNVLDFTPGFQKYMTHRVNNAKEPSRTSIYLEDVPELPDHPDGDHNTWSHHQCAGFCPRFPKIYDTWGQYCNGAIKNILVLGGCSWASWSSWWRPWYLKSLLMYWILPKVSENIWHMGSVMPQSHQEHPCTWRMFLSFLIILMLILMTGVDPIKLENSSWSFWCLNQVSISSGCWDIAS